MKKKKQQKSYQCSGNVIVAHTLGNVSVNYNVDTTNKRKQEEDYDSDETASSSGFRTNKQRRVYLFDDYSLSDSEVAGDEKWVVDGKDVASIARQCRARSVRLAQGKKHLSDARILSLSHIYLLTLMDNCMLRRVSQRTRSLILSDALGTSQIIFLENNIVLACREMQKMLGEDGELEGDVLLELRNEASRAKDENLKTCVKILEDLSSERYFSTSEANLLINVIKTFMSHCVFTCPDIKSQWLTYSFSFSTVKGKSQLVYPDCAAFTDANGIFELFFLEVQGWPKKENFKLGKQLQVALNKRIDAGVEDAVVVGLHVKRVHARFYLMDLRSNGLYRMSQAAIFDFPRSKSCKSAFDARNHGATLLH